VLSSWSLSKIIPDARSTKHKKKPLPERYYLTFWRRNYFSNFSTHCI